MPFDPKSQRYLYPHPTKRGAMVSRQRIKQLRWRSEGRCQKCGDPRPKSLMNLCRECQDAKNGDQRAEATSHV